MHAIILAAGIGRRLTDLTRGRPKCLLQLGGRSLLARYLDALQALDVRAASIVVGYRKELIMAEVAAIAPTLPVRWVVNDLYHRGSIYSLWMAQSEFDDHLLLMDGDVLFPRIALRRLLESPLPNAILVDPTVEQRDEERMAFVRNGRVVALSKVGSPIGTCQGEGVGFLKVMKPHAEQIRNSLRPCMAKGNLDMEYEDALGDFFQTVEVGYEEIGGLPWIEIDCPEDLRRAQQEILPRVNRLNQRDKPGEKSDQGGEGA